MEQEKFSQEEALAPGYENTQLEDAGSIRGWLLLFFILGAFSSVASVIINIAQVETLTFSLSMSDTVYALGRTALVFWMINAFVQRTPDAVSVAKTYLCLNIAYGVVVFGAAAMLGFPNAEIIKIGAQSVIYGIIWYIFMNSSSQVAERIPEWYRRPNRAAQIFGGLVIVAVIALFAIGISEIAY